MSVTQLMAGQCGSEQHQWIGLGCEFVQKTDKGLVQRTKPASLDPAIKQDQQIRGNGQWRQARWVVDSR